MRNAVCLALIQFVSSAFACSERLQLQIVKLPLSNWLQNGRGNTEAAVQQRRPGNPLDTAVAAYDFTSVLKVSLDI